MLSFSFLTIVVLFFVESLSFDIKEIPLHQGKTNVLIFHLLPSSSRFVKYFYYYADINLLRTIKNDTEIVLM